MRMRHSVATLGRSKDPDKPIQVKLRSSRKKKHPGSVFFRLMVFARASATSSPPISLGLIVLLSIVLKTIIQSVPSSTTSPTPMTSTSRESGRQPLSVPLQVQLLSAQDANDLLDNVSHSKAKPSPEKALLGEEWANEKCVPMHKWQLMQYSPVSCNIFHETTYSDMHLINCGGSRCAYQVQDSQGEPVVLKTPK